MKYLLALIPFSLFGVVNLGELGTSYDIAEPDIKAQLRQGIQNLDYKQLRRQALESINAVKNVSADIPACVEERHFDMANVYTYDRDITDIKGVVLFHKGEQTAIHTKRPSSLCIVDGTTPEALERSIKRVIQKGPCDKTMIAGGSVDLLARYQKIGKAYPYDPLLAKTLHAHCYPVRITLKEKRIYFDEFGGAQ